jgi:Cu2+-exporting ATPase
MLFEIIIVSGFFLYTGNVIRKIIPDSKEWLNQRRTPPKIDRVTKKIPKKDSPARLPDNPSAEQKHTVVRSEREINRRLVASSISTLLSAAGGLYYPPLALTSIPGLVYSGSDIFISAYRSLFKEKKLNVDLTIAVIITACIADGLLFICNLNALLAMLNRKLLLKIKDTSQHDVIDVFRQQPQKAWMLDNGLEVEIPVELLKQGDIIVVKGGEPIPVDGAICFGRALIDQHLLTGESQPAEKGPDEKVFALTLVLSGRIGIRVEKAGQETTAAQIGRILNQTTDLKTDMQLWAEEAGKKAVPPFLLLSGICLPFLGTTRALAVLNSHPKYKTTITTYIGVLNFLSIASSQGILIKDGRVFELLKKVDTVVFDKTGTLTENKMYISKIHACEGYEEDDILTFAAIVEQRQTHPIAIAILQEAAVRQLILPESGETEYKIGYGLAIKKNKETIRVGSIRFIETEDIPIPPGIKEIQESCRQRGHFFILVAVNDVTVGGVELHAGVRKEVGAVFKGLRHHKITSVYIVSGDHEIPTKRLSDALGADRYFAEVLPEDKANLIEQLQKEGRTVCFVGDGINDSIALKKADVSVSLRGASTIATDTAQIVLMDESLHRFCTLFDLANDYDSNMKKTFIAGLIPHFIGFFGALFLDFGLLHSIVLNQSGLALGVGNAILPRVQQRQKNSKSLQDKTPLVPAQGPSPAADVPA